MRKRTLGCTLVAIVAVGMFAWEVFSNSHRISSVLVQIQPGKVEPTDPVVLGFGADDRDPDYNLRIRMLDRFRWVDCGTFQNRPIDDGLTFVVPKRVPLHQAVELKLLDADRMESDILEQLPVDATSLKGDRYTMTIETSRDVHSGIAWFFDTPVGQAVFAGIAIAIATVILILVAPFLTSF